MPRTTDAALLASTASAPWRSHLRGDPLPWLLDRDTPAVRAATLARLLDLPEDHSAVRTARRAAMRTDPIAPILADQHPDGWWQNPGAGYGPKYTGTVWQLIFLDQLGADPRNRQVQKACRYVLQWSAAESGGFGARGGNREIRPSPSQVLHCINGNLLHALLAFGHLDHPTIDAAINWAAAAIAGDPRPAEGDPVTYYRSGTSGPNFECAANDRRPCAWGAIKELNALALLPPSRRTPEVTHAIEIGVDLLLSRDPAVADYPMPARDKKPSSSWFKLGFPSGYVADVLQNLEVLAALGHAADPRLDNAYDLVLAGQDEDGRWRNRYAYNRKTTVDFEHQGDPSKWVTLRACSVLKARYG
jgi:hypothetical protein